MEELYQRIGKKVKLKEIAKQLCMIHNIGEYVKHKIIKVGIDDLSFYLWTTTGKYIVKNFNYEKTLSDINRYLKIYHILMKNKIKVPQLLSVNDRSVFSFEVDGLYMNSCVLECIEGKDLYSLNQLITKEEIDQLVELVISLHSIKDIVKIEEYDLYSFIRLKEVIEKTKEVISKEFKKEINLFMEEYIKVDFKKLPKTFIHGDLINTNIMKDKNKEIWLIDFTETGTGIRILDIVKIINEVIFNYNYIEESIELGEYFLKKYQEKEKLTDYELNVLDIVRLADAYVVTMLAKRDILEQNLEEHEFFIKNEEMVIDVLKNKRK